MRLPFILTETATAKTLMINLLDHPHVLTSEHARFTEILALVTTEVDPDELPERTDAITDLINFAEPALEQMRQLSTRVSTFGGSLFFDGDPVDGRLAEHILAKLDQGDDNWSGPVRFMERLMNNPAKHVRRRLFKWVSDRGMTITPEGLLIGYKGVQPDDLNSSITRGTNTVWVDGVAHVGYIPNPIGATVTMARSEVDNDRDAGCSQGLHVGTFDYAQAFTGSGSVLVVSFDPRDVVAIPKDEDYAKIRVCRYTVLDTTKVKYNRPTWIPAAADVEPEEDEDERDVSLCSGCGETEDGEPTCDECLAAEDATHSYPTVAMLDGDR